MESVVMNGRLTASPFLSPHTVASYSQYAIPQAPPQKNHQFVKPFSPWQPKATQSIIFITVNHQFSQSNLANNSAPKKSPWENTRTFLGENLEIYEAKATSTICCNSPF